MAPHLPTGRNVTPEVVRDSPEVELRICLSKWSAGAWYSNGMHGRFVGKEKRSIER